ncbi:secretin receptor precursor [Oryctolagus cuniculus]|uniref:Secretin receptor n=1 Tax=Oryctolagus cuniculus TaxID=9986 RepID=SCTR_RABIT|nr:secretin receptor precursor [Oryctolagus cuniculus]O46502.1 RecName: Full=Secretin receptor; Short=SCT-R; Flags: Precursor [Oryctolagus cuniculus]AAC32767.1 secretin receptor precursor [Oryctolagus cuniculus]
MCPRPGPPLGLWLLLGFACAAHLVGAPPRLCDVLWVLQEERDQCLQELERERLGEEQPVPGCQGLWDNVSCWPSSAPGRMVELECPRFLRMLTNSNGSLFRNCTQDGWTETFPRPDLACGVSMNDSSHERQHAYLLKLKVMYTVGYSSSLVMLLVALGILCAFRRLHCTRNYIHMHLFLSFILRALSNFIKDAVLFSSDDAIHCDAHRVGCKLVMVFFQYCIMANYAWLLVEGLYLHSLLVVSFFSERKCLQGFVVLGWGSPAMFVTSWAVTRHFLEDSGCWDINANAAIWWVIRGPVILSILINFILFINILRILTRKLRTQETRGQDMNHYKRLARSTLLLIPLFGVHYIVFVFSPEGAMEIQLFFELALGSFQGLVVAVLYCFLNGEVQLEVQKKWQQWHLWEPPLCPVALSSSFSNGTSSLNSTKACPSGRSRDTCKVSII